MPPTNPPRVDPLNPATVEAAKQWVEAYEALKARATGNKKFEENVRHIEAFYAPCEGMSAEFLRGLVSGVAATYGQAIDLAESETYANVMLLPCVGIVAQHWLNKENDDGRDSDGR